MYTHEQFLYQMLRPLGLVFRESQTLP